MDTKSLILTSNEEVIKNLQSVLKNRQEIYKTIQRKRNWRPSEKAMTLAEVGTQIEAVQIAINVFWC